MDNKVNELPDSLEIGTAGKGGAIKVYGDYNKPDEFRTKINNALALRLYAKGQVEG